MSKSKNIALGVLIRSIGTLGIAALGGIAYVYSGGYNVAATEPHAPTMRWALDTSYHHSVQPRSDMVEAPADFTLEMVEAGARPTQKCAPIATAPRARSPPAGAAACAPGRRSCGTRPANRTARRSSGWSKTA